ncbi:hypothetical protein [Pusillimonas sp.]|uniref:hypothetical protein n=1 Tax=Pusillimonas sp. TaxID=3040095 RepID=UPI0029A6709B|nr:hypothetical protein [Pusillimonas sp.]MDX3893433.1 hypothetical protein [Pusillimonas sp.]
MVSKGFIQTDKPIPSPELSFVRMFNDSEAGWQQRGQYSIWAGESKEGGQRFRLLERFGNRVGAIEHADGRSVLHKVSAGTSFTIEGLLGFWLKFDCDAMWLDTPCPSGRYSLLAVGGTAGKPGQAVVDWVCPKCGESLHPQTIAIGSGPRAFKRFLSEAEGVAAAFNSDADLRACGNCGSVHPETTTDARNEPERLHGERN